MGHTPASEFLGATIRRIEFPAERSLTFYVSLSSGHHCTCQCNRQSSRGTTEWYHTALHLLVASAKKRLASGDLTPAWIGEQQLREKCEFDGRRVLKHTDSDYIWDNMQNNIVETGKIFSVTRVSQAMPSEHLEFRRIVADALRTATRRQELPTEERQYAFALTASSPATSLSIEDYLLAGSETRSPASEQFLAHLEYFRQGDSIAMVKFRDVLAYDRSSARRGAQARTRARSVSAHCNFLEQWARAVFLGFLHIKEFDSSSGDMAASVLLQCAPDIRAHRLNRNPRYSMWHARLVLRILDAGMLDHWPNSLRADLRVLAEELSSPLVFKSNAES